ncbi:RNA-directed DNA polymerase from mobile element jockey [Trichonephila clavipes]|nr:RNA-directed DNA polymerase from mobile element jockey [Trichonephila clavipes]
MDQPHLFDVHTASSVAQVNQGRAQDLVRGPSVINMLQAPQSKRYSKYLRLLQCNINGLSTVVTRIKLDQILKIAERLHLEIIALQETKLCKQRLLNAKGYNIIRRDRASCGGGLMFLIRDVHFQRLPVIGNDTSDLEYLGITALSKDRTITIKNLYYLSNSQHLDKNMMEGLFDDNTIILEDFNVKNTTWGSTITNARGLKLSNLINDKVFINDGTYTFRSDSYGSTDVLDWTFISPDYRTSNTKLWKLAKQIDNLNPSNEETNAIISDNGCLGGCSESDTQHYANESKLAFSSSDKHLARVTRDQIKSCRDRPADNSLFNVDFTLPKLSYALQNLDTNKSPDPIVSLDISCPTLEFWVGKDSYTYKNLSWKTNKLPRQWKSAIVIPIYKPNKNAGLTTSYRPISLTCITCRLMECMVLPRLTSYLYTNNLMPPEKVAFRKAHSTVDQILYFT